MRQSKIKPGQRFGSVVVKERDLSQTHRPYWFCNCDCGSLTSIRSTELKPNKRCRECYWETITGNKHYGWTGEDNITGSFWHEYVRSAQRRNLKFEIDKSYIIKLYNQQEGLCNLSKIPLTYSKNLSIDRIDSRIGYVENNIQLLDKQVNKIKWILSNKEFVRICELILDNQKEVGQYQNRTCYNHSHWGGFGDVGAMYFNNIKKRAGWRDLDFQLTIEDFWNIFVAQNYRCCLTGLILKFDTDIKLQTASMDRIDNNLGYLLGNVRWIYKPINFSRGTMDNDRYIELCQKIGRVSRQSKGDN